MNIVKGKEKCLSKITLFYGKDTAKRMSNENLNNNDNRIKLDNFIRNLSKNQNLRYSQSLENNAKIIAYYKNC